MSSLLPLAAVIAVVTLLATPRARADAIPPPPTDCPPGQVGSSSHGGPWCAAAPPTDCPSGWRGAIGGVCVLSRCSEDAHCPKGERCAETSLCFLPQRQYDRSRVSPEEEEKRRNTIVVEDEALDVCLGGKPCNPTGKCQTGRLCLAPGAAPAPAPKNAEPQPVPYRRPGCAGCAEVRPEDTSTAVLGMGCGLLALALRARRRSRHRA